MRGLHTILIASTLLLAACGDNSQQAEGPSPGSKTDGRTAQQQAPETTGSVQRPSTPAATPSATPAPSASTAATSPPAGAQPAQPTASAGTLAPAFQGRTFASDATWIQFSSDNRFTMRDNATQRVVRGRYALEGDRITFSEPQGETNGLAFPLTCRVRQNGAERFTLDDPACARFGGQTFQAQAG
jgi:cytoskeletal protein RodZ